jgi:hypothetical protein
LNEPLSGTSWSALVTFTTSNRVAFVKRCLPWLARACASDGRLALLVALDGDDPGTRAFCRQWDVPLLYSDAREGVGLSKNRVVQHFPDYDYYFFLEDDIEILDGALFARHVELMQAAGIHHMALFGREEGRGALSETTVLGERIVSFAYGSAELNVFTRTGLERVGGWHPMFAQYKRWGHTEHSYRFPRSELAPAPFNVAVSLADTCIRHRPPSVTPGAGLAPVDDDHIALPERELMRQELRYVPLETIAPYYAENRAPGQLPELARLVGSGTGRYPLLEGAERRQATADYLVWRSENETTGLRSGGTLLFAGAICPSNLAVRHVVKMRLLSLARRLRGLARG